MAALTANPGRMAEVVLAVGANLGDRAQNIRQAVDALACTPGVFELQLAPIIETDPVGGPTQPQYLNSVILAQTNLSPEQILAHCLRIEAQLGRIRVLQNGPRTLDLDLISYLTTPGVWATAVVRNTPELTLPHPRAQLRRFVLQPWAQLQPKAQIRTRTGLRPISEILAELPS